MDNTVPKELVFDDEPLDRILYGVDCPKATPADILERWRDREEIPSEGLDAIASILAREPEKGSAMESWQLTSVVAYVAQCQSTAEGENPRELLKLARICHAAGQVEQAEAAYRQALKSRDRVDPLTEAERRQAQYNLAGLFDRLGRVEDAKEIRSLCEGEQILAYGSREELITVRSLACELYVAGKYEAAEKLYRGLIKRRFQQPGTLIHLTRVLLMQDRLQEARIAVAAAWRLMRDRDMHQVTSPYVFHRISFFRILCAMLARGNFSRQVATLRKELLGTASRESWTIAPVVEHFKPYLRTGDVRCLEAISEAINSSENMDRLNAFAVWTDGEDVFND